MPLGNPLGKPFDRSMHRETLRLALTLAVDAKSPGTVVETSFVWDAFDTDKSWKRNFCFIDPNTPEKYLAMGEVCFIDPNTPEKYLAMGEENRQRRLDNKAKGLFRE